MKVIGMLLPVLLISLLAVQSPGADAIDEFDSPILNEDLWTVLLVGDATSEIADGMLTLTSPGVESGAIIYYATDVENADITFEVLLDTSGLGDNITLGFIADIMEPQMNTDINNNLEACFFFVPANWYLKQDPETIGVKPPNTGIEGAYDPGWNTVGIDCSASKGTITFFFNGEEVAVVDKNPDVQSRYLHITCDPFTSHYSGAVAIDYVKFGGVDTPSSVEPGDKLTATWGRLKK